MQQGTHIRGGEDMADRIEMAKYWHQYQEAELKANRARIELERLKNSLLQCTGREDLVGLKAKIDAAQVKYDVLKAECDNAYSLATTGQPRQNVVAAEKVEWFTPWGTPIGKR